MRDERKGGYLASAFIFAAITGLWAWIVRDDPYYGMTQLLGLSLPVATVVYLTLAPALGFVVGRWRYQSTGARGAGAWLAKTFARALHFLYAHILIVLFTAAMAFDYFLGWNIDNAVRDIDDGLFDIASRFAPWLSAYLAGFNFGRAAAGGGNGVEPVGAVQNQSVSSVAETQAGGSQLLAVPTKKQLQRPDGARVEPPISLPENPFEQPDTDLDPKTRKPRFSRLR